MGDLYIAPTNKTPEISFQIDGDLSITGNSYPENVNEFYVTIIDWLDKYLNSNTNSITLTIYLKYINTSSTKSILNIITKIGGLAKSTVKVSWIYELEDDDMFATGEDLEKLSRLKFDFNGK